MTEPGADEIGLNFGSAAQRYDRYRVGYPDEVFAAVAGYATRPIRIALEVGAGTGKATRLFATHGVHVTALEPDVRMAALLTGSAGDDLIDPVVTTFERYRAAGPFDLLFAATAWHWTDPATRWARAADRLAPGGTLALLGAPADLNDPDLYAAVDRIEQDLLPDRDRSAGSPWTVDDLTARPEFGDVRQLRFPRIQSIPASTFVERLATISVYLALDARSREAILGRIRSVLPEQVEIDATTTATLARRR